MPDKHGELQPVLDFKYQDFVDLYNLRNRLQRRDQPPKYSLQKIDVTGRAHAQYAELTIRIAVLLRGDDWIRIPLRLDEALLHGAAKYEGEGRQFLCYEADGDGYVCWLRGQADSEHKITLDVLVPLASAGPQTRLKLFVPRAAESQLSLSVPLAKAVGQVSEGTMLLSKQEVKDGTTDFSVVGLGGEFQLAWQKPGPPTIDAPLVIEASAAVHAKFDGRAIAANAVLQVRSRGAPFDHFVVRLPPGAELTPGNPTTYVVAPLNAGGKDGGRQRTVEIRLNKKTTGPVEVRLACRRDYDPAKSRSWCELAGFEVVGAVRQWGTIAVSTGSQWQLLWGPSSNVRPTEPLPDASQAEDVGAAFEYSAQPYSLSARLAPRRTRVRVDPEYVLSVDRGQMRLEGRLRYVISGPKLATLDVAIPGWELDDVALNDIVLSDRVIQSGGNITVALPRPTSAAVELQLRAHRLIQDGARSLSVVLPQPKCDTAMPMSLAVVAADNVELSPDPRGTSGLIREQTALIGNLPRRQQAPIFYRGTSGKATFAAGVQVHKQRIRVEVASQVTLGPHTAEVTQKQSYAISYEPVDRLTITLPRSLAVANQIRVSCDGRPLSPAALVESADDVDASDTMNVELPGSWIGKCELTLAYSVPIAEPTPGQPSTLPLPLPMPRDGRLVANTLCIRATGNIRPTADGGDWTAAGEADSGVLRLTSDKLVERARLKLAWQADQRRDTAIIDRAWVQTWLTSQERQDRAVFRLTTKLKELELVLPRNVQADQCAVLVDGKPAKGRMVDDGRLLIPLTAQSDGRPCRIELQYHFAGRPPRGSLALELPQIAGAWVRRMYWQLVLPNNEHLVGNPAGFTSEFTWDWFGYFWGRQPLLDQPDLDAWTGATTSSTTPQRDNIYLFSTLGNPRVAQVRTAGRTWIVLWASGIALVVGLLLIYVPASRHPAALLVLCLVLLTAGLVAPEPTLLFAQAASLGLAMTLVAGMLERRVVARRRRTITRVEPPSGRPDSGSTRTPIAQPPSAALTESLPALAPQSPEDGEQ